MTANPARHPLRCALSLCALLALLAGGSRTTEAEEIIFTIDPAASSLSWSGNVSGIPLAPQSPGSLSAPISGHFLVDFDPTSGTPSSLQFVGGHGYYEAASPHFGLPGPAPSNATGSAGGLVFAVRNLVWDFTSGELIGTGGVFPAGQTSYHVLSGHFATNALGTEDVTGAIGSMDNGTWVLSESSPGSGEWTLLNSADVTAFSEPGILLLAHSSIVATAQYSAANLEVVTAGATTAQALGGASTTGGVSASFTAPSGAGAGTFSVQKIANPSGLSAASVAAAELNELYSISTEALSVAPQIWNVDFDGDLNGGTVELVFAYDESILPAGINEALLGIWHYDSATGDWEFGGIVDTNNNTITYTTDSFSPFHLGVAQVVPEPSTALLALLAGGILCWWKPRRR